jgi:perosamine synthetase
MWRKKCDPSEITGLPWFYEMVDLGYNYRLNDMQCALGISQLQKLSRWIDRRQAIARRYNQAFSRQPLVRPLAVKDDVSNSYHLYVIKIDYTKLPFNRAAVFAKLRAKGIGANVHYIPVHLHPYYRKTFGTGPGLCPVAEAAYEQILSLPMHPALTDKQIDTVCNILQNVLGK